MKWIFEAIIRRECKFKMIVETKLFFLQKNRFYIQYLEKFIFS